LQTQQSKTGKQLSLCNKAEKDWGSCSVHQNVGLQKPSCTKQRCLTDWTLAQRSPNEAPNNPKVATLHAQTSLSNMGPLMGNPMQTLESHDTGSLANCRASPGSQTQAGKMLCTRNPSWWIVSRGATPYLGARPPCHN
jgi:hypothetical protein